MWWVDPNAVVFSSQLVILTQSYSTPDEFKLCQTAEPSPLIATGEKKRKNQKSGEKKSKFWHWNRKIMLIDWLIARSVPQRTWKSQHRCLAWDICAHIIWNGQLLSI